MKAPRTNSTLRIYPRGRWFWIRGKNSWGVKVERHSTERTTEKAAYAYLNHIDGMKQEEYDAFRAAKNGNAPAEPPKETTKLLLTTALELWLRTYTVPEAKRVKSEMKGDTTRDTYEWRVKIHLIAPMEKQGITHLRDIKRFHLRNLQQRWLDEGRSINSIKNYRNASNVMFGHFVKYGEEHGEPDFQNPWDKVDHPKTDETGKATLPLDTESGDATWQLVRSSIIPFLRKNPKRRQLLQRPENFLALLDLIYMTGLRRIDAVQFRPDLITQGKLGGIYQTKQEKTGDDVTVFLPQELADRLRALPTLPWRNYKHPDYEGAGLYPFWDGSCQHLTAYMSSVINKPLCKLGRELGIDIKDGDSLRPHRLRDSFAVNRLISGMPIEKVSLLLGHKNVKMTENYYAPKNIPSRIEALEA